MNKVKNFLFKVSNALFGTQGILLVLLLLFLIEIGYITDGVLGRQFALKAAVLPSILIEETNQQRTQNSLPTLSVNPLLVQAAQMKAQDMANRGYFSHDTPDGKNPWYWLDQVGYTYKFAGENLAVNFTESTDVTRAWMNSPSHKENIVKDHYTEIGIATALGMYKGRESIFVVQFFGTPVKQNTFSKILPQAKTVKKTPVTKTPTSSVVKENTSPLNDKKPTITVLGEDIETSTKEVVVPSNKINISLGAFLGLVIVLFALRSLIARISFAPVLRSLFLIAVIAGLIYINENVLPAHLLSNLDSYTFWV
ncbi:MAG: CAP domain-containing protein [Candidatus Paceibacteria bacterium]